MSEWEEFHSRGAKIGTLVTKFSPTGDKTISGAPLLDCLLLESWKWTMQIVSPESYALTTLSLGCHLAIFTRNKFQQIVSSNDQDKHK